jgi:Flp pilus assembly protein TadG
MIIPLLAMIAVAVDLGYLVQVKTELQSTADSAALAGVQELQTPYLRWNLPGAPKDSIRSAAISSAKAKARTYGTYNTAGAVSITLLDADIEVGFLDENGNYNPNPPTNVFPNSVRVLARRDGQSNGAVSLFFAPVIGTSNVELQARARATMYTGRIDSLARNGFNGGVLPMTYDVNHWNNFFQTGEDPDGKTYIADNGAPQLRVYPSIKFTGNFGELSLDDVHAGTSEIREWINNGITQTDINDLISRDLVPLSGHDPAKWDWLGNPGFRASSVQEVNQFQGETYLLPLFKPVNSDPKNYQGGVGGGSDFNWNIVRFVPVMIMPPDRENREIYVQPSGHVDPTAVFDYPTIVPAGTANEVNISEVSFTTAKLTE